MLPCLKLTTDGGEIFVPADKIVFIESSGEGSKLRLADGDYVIATISAENVAISINNTIAYARKLTLDVEIAVSKELARGGLYVPTGKNGGPR